MAIGDGKYAIDTGPDIIQLPENIVTLTCGVDELVSKVHPNLLSNFRNMSWLSEWCILAPLNETTCTVNATLVAQLPGEPVEYKSLDSVLDESHAVHFLIEFLNSREVSGFPSHTLSSLSHAFR